MAIKRRLADPQDEDHTQERHPPVDWKIIAPRWFLIATISVLFLSCGWLLGVNKNLSDDRMSRMEKYNSDARWDLLTRHSEDIAELRRALVRQAAQLEKLEEMAQDVRVLRRIAEEESRRKVRRGAYGM